MRAEEVLNALYLGSLEPGSMLPSAVGLLADFAGHPTVFHCAAGKDRVAPQARTAPDWWLPSCCACWASMTT